MTIPQQNRPPQPQMPHPMIPGMQPIPNNHIYQQDKVKRNDVPNQQDVPPPLPTSPPPIEPSYQTVYSQKPASMRSQRLNENSQNSPTGYEKQHEPPAPPTRKSSYEITNQMSAISGSNRYTTSSMRNCDSNGPHHTKKVSFHDSPMENPDCDTNGNLSSLGSNNSQSYTLDDINEVLATPHNSQNLNTYAPGSTPGVIGSQEVYRDPRQRIEAERTQGTARVPGPEKLSFHEKMKMFAQELGDPDTPKDKVKTSRAQRDIEVNLNGSNGS